MTPGGQLYQELNRRLSELRLPAIRGCYEEKARQAERETLAYEQYLRELVERECEERTNNRVARLLRDSALPLEKSLETFDMKRLPERLARQIKMLAEGGFVDRRENVLAFGQPGGGKTHALAGIGQQLVRRSGRRVLFTMCVTLVQGLLAAKRDLRLSQAIKKLDQYEALVIDDIGYVQQNREEMEVLFMLLAERYERRTVMITSNLPFSKWDQIFKDPMTTAAAIDRLVHHSVILDFGVASFRMEQAKRRTSAQQRGE